MSGSTEQATLDARHRIAAMGGLALLVAGLVLVAIVLPAEYAVDPLGTGARLGLLPLGEVAKQVEALEAAAQSGEAVQGSIVTASDRPFQQETVTFTLAGGESMEYKYRLDKGSSLLYSWTATVPVDYELHAEPDGAPPGYAQTYEKQSGRDHASGTLVTPFSGIHGWFWENTSRDPITVTLSAAGYYPISHEFRTNSPVKNKTFK